MTEMTDDYRAGWRAACAHLHDTFAETGMHYSAWSSTEAMAGTYARVAELAQWNADRPQRGLAVVTDEAS